MNATYPSPDLPDPTLAPLVLNKKVRHYIQFNKKVRHYIHKYISNLSFFFKERYYLLIQGFGKTTFSLPLLGFEKVFLFLL
jgi:hypothetical protein